MAEKALLVQGGKLIDGTGRPPIENSVIVIQEGRFGALEPNASWPVSKDKLKAILSPEAIAKAGAYIVTLKCEGEPFPESNRAHLVVGFKP